MNQRNGTFASFDRISFVLDKVSSFVNDTKRHLETNAIALERVHQDVKLMDSIIAFLDIMRLCSEIQYLDRGVAIRSPFLQQ